MSKIIYKITNLINNKLYVGKTEQTLRKRWLEHVQEARRYKKCGNLFYKTRFYPAMVKYGFNNFKIELVEQVAENDNIDDREKYWISKLQTQNPDIGYNIADGGMGGALFKGHKHSAQSKEKMSQHNYWKNKKQSREFILKRIKNNCKEIQNLETGEIFKSKKEAKRKYGTSIDDAIKNGHRASGCHFILIINHKYNKKERNELIQQLDIKNKEIKKKSIQKMEDTRSRWDENKNEQWKSKISNSLHNTINHKSLEEKESIKKHLQEINKQKFLNIISKINKEEFVDLYINQNKKHVYMQKYYGITDWTLNKIIKEFKCNKKHYDR